MISIVIPVYNAESYLDECVSSVISQTYQDWECILVDDGSTDGSADICDKWCAKDCRISVIHQENRGVSTARNQGIEKAKGDYITFIDSDDWVNSEYLADMYNGMALGGDIDVVSTGVIQHKASEEKTYVAATQETIMLNGKYADVFLDNIGLFYGPIAKLYKLERIRYFSVRFPEKISLGEDTLFNFNYLEHARNVLLLPRSNYHYRILPLSNLTLYRPDRFDIRYNQWKVQVAFLQTHGMWNNHARQLFGNRLWEIVYEGVFSIKNPSLKYLKYVMTIPDAHYLKEYHFTFYTSWWIKWLIKKKNYITLYLIRKIK